MDDATRTGLREALVHLDPALTLDSVWRDDPHHIDGMHPRAFAAFQEGMDAALRSEGPSVQGLVIQGEQGVGKTHFLGQIRRTVQGRGFFVFVQLVDGRHFWESMAQGFTLALLRKLDGGTQLQTLLLELAELQQWQEASRAAIVAGEPLDKAALQQLILAFRQHPTSRRAARGAHEALRALLLLSSSHPLTQDVGDAYLQSLSLQDDYAEWGFRGPPPPPQAVVRQVGSLMALVRPVVIAVDQIDSLVAGAVKGQELSASDTLTLEQIGGGLMDVRDTVPRSLTLLSVLSATWELVQDQVVKSAAQRFDEVDLARIPDSTVARSLILARVGPAYQRAGFVPPYPSWPVQDPVFDEVVLTFTPRQFLRRVRSHVQTCLRDNEWTELTTALDGAAPKPGERRGRPGQHKGTVDSESGVVVSDEVLESLDARYADHLQATPAPKRTPDTEDEVVPRLLRSGLASLKVELGDVGATLTQDTEGDGARAALHARLRQVVDEDNERERLWSFRAIGQGHARAVLSRLKGAATRSGIESVGTDRYLVLLRKEKWPGAPGTQTQLLISKVHGLNGRTFAMSDEDGRVFTALAALSKEGPPHLAAWLRSRQPAFRTPLFRQVFAWAPLEGVDVSVGYDLNEDSETEHDADNEGIMPLGRGYESSRSVDVPLEMLRKHAVIFAGSGSGKTVLIRRIIEEAALRGVSAIVLDPNNDLARLGDGWPEPPKDWGAGDGERAERYLANTDVVVWTPRRASGRALSFRPLPDFRAVRDDPEALGTAVDTAVASLAPRARVDGNTAKADQCRAVLKSAMFEFARWDEHGIDRFVRLLRALPDSATPLERGQTYAAEMAETLQAARINDPLFGGEGEAADPAVLLTPAPGKHARVSVISFVGLPDDKQRQSFVNQLQMALFSWAQRNPTKDKPLGGLFVMDEAQNFAPSGRMTACTQSTLALVSQARKYGLGLVFATQAPKGLHNRIPGNATTQFFGKMQAPAQIAAAKDFASAKSGRVDDIASLGPGEFYVTSDELPLQKVRTRLCLSHHPPSPLTEEEVIGRARGSESRHEGSEVS